MSQLNTSLNLLADLEPLHHRLFLSFVIPATDTLLILKRCERGLGGPHAVCSPCEEWHVRMSYGNEQVWSMLGQVHAAHTQNTFLDKNETCCKCVEQEAG